MRNFILLLLLLFTVTSVATAQEDTQSANVEKSGLVFKMQKQTHETPSKQEINVSKSGLVFILQWGGCKRCKKYNIDIEELKNEVVNRP